MASVMGQGRSVFTGRKDRKAQPQVGIPFTAP